MYSVIPVSLFFLVLVFISFSKKYFSFYLVLVSNLF